MTAGFIGKFYLIEATVDGDYAWLGIVIVVGSMISLAYYLRVVVAIWMQERAEVPVGTGTGLPALAGGAADAATAAGPAPVEAAPAAVGARDWEVRLVAAAFGAAILGFGIVPSPLFELAVDAGAALGNLV
jgi:NADH-quinone oxidoreductase subunit N